MGPIRFSSGHSEAGHRRLLPLSLPQRLLCAFSALVYTLPLMLGVHCEGNEVHTAT